MLGEQASHTRRSHTRQKCADHPLKEKESLGHVVKLCFSEGIFTGSYEFGVQAESFLRHLT